MNAFHTYVGNRDAPEADKFQHLLLCLSGIPRKMLGGMASAPYSLGFFRDAINILARRYGTGERLEDYFSTKIQRFPLIRRLDFESIVELSALLDEIYYHTRSRHPEDYQERLVRWHWLATNLRYKLPRPEQIAFCGELTKAHKKENVLTFREYIHWKYEIFSKCDPYEWEEKPGRTGELRS